MINPSTLDLKTLPWLPLTEKSAFPKQAAIYFAIDSLGCVQYIGRSVNVRARWGSHHKYSTLNNLGNVKVAYLFVDMPELLPQIETALIKYFKPCLNREHAEKRVKQKKLSLCMERIRKTRTFRLDEIVIDGLNELAKRKNSSANRLLENTLFELLIKEGIILNTVEPLGETRGREKND